MPFCQVSLVNLRLRASHKRILYECFLLRINSALKRPGGTCGGAREMKNGGADKLHFPPEWLLLWVSRTPVGTSSLTQWVLSVRALPVLLAYLAQVSFSS